ncbi:MAG: hypothetical protein R3C56_01045 [Pirellulaceae bacterium]
MKKALALLSVAALTVTFSLSSLAQAPQASTTAAQSSPPAGKLVLADAKLATLRAKFVYDGDAPAPKKVDSSKDPFCAQLEVLSEVMLVGKDGGLQNLVLMFDAKRSKAKVPAEFAKPADGIVKLDNNGCIFVPHIVSRRSDRRSKCTIATKLDITPTSASSTIQAEFPDPYRR